LRAAAGEPFRDAYRKVAEEIARGTFVPPTAAPDAALGAPQRLELRALGQEIGAAGERWRALGMHAASAEAAVFAMEGSRSK